MDIYQTAGLTGADGFAIARLDIRPLKAADAPALARGLSDPAVRRYMPRMPDPYGIDEAAKFIANVEASRSRDWAVWRNNALIGGLSFNQELGFWLAPDHWGQGLAVEMGQAVLSRWFARPEAWTVYSSHLPGNAASARVQAKLGLTPIGHTGTHIRTALTPDQWHLQNPWVIETDRLRLAPLETRHANAFAALTGVPQIATMTGSMKIGWGATEVAAWIHARRWRGQMGFVHGIWLKETDALIGQVRMGASAPPDIGYIVAPDQWGQGYAFEAARAMLQAATKRFQPSEIVASAFQDNPASQAILVKLGFDVIGEKQVEVPARLEPAMIYKYRLTTGIKGSST